MIKGYVEPINPAYQQWIDKNVPVDCQQWCVSKAKAMVEEFPELRVVGVAWMDWGHAWCVNAQGEVVDPTAHQFEFGYPFDYTCNKLEAADFPNKCQYCQEYIWKDTPGVRAYLHEDEEAIGPHDHCYEMFKKDMIKDLGEERAKKIFG